MINLTSRYHDKYRTSNGDSAFLNYTGGSLKRAKLNLINNPTFRSNSAFHGKGAGAMVGFIRLGLNDIEVRTMNQKVNFRSCYGMLNKHPGHYRGKQLMSVDELLHKLGV